MGDAYSCMAVWHAPFERAETYSQSQECGEWSPRAESQDESQRASLRAQTWPQRGVSESWRDSLEHIDTRQQTVVLLYMTYSS